MIRSLLQFFFRHKIIRYLFSGSVGAFVHIGTVYLLTHVLFVWYQYATITGFFLALGVSFAMQKFFTFQDGRTNVLTFQSSLFASVALINLVFNSGLMYLFVEKSQLPPAIAQVCTALILAISSFLLYSKIFKNSGDSTTPERPSVEHSLEKREE